MNNGTRITVERLKKEFHYDPETGVLSRKDGSNNNVGSANSGYLRISIDSRLYPVHVLAWLYFYGKLPTQEVDHKNLNKLDNRIENLRLATHAQQAANVRLKSINTTGAKGVRIRKSVPNRPYEGLITVNGKMKYLGAHATLDEAAHAYNKAAIHYFGEFACLNPIGRDKETA